MSVEQWKRAISLTVLIVILFLVGAVGVLSMKLHHANAALEKKSVIDLEDYTGLQIEDGRNLLGYLEQIYKSGQASYQNKYPALYVENDFQYVDTPQKTCYLTFDDGPTEDITEQVLDILKAQDVKATFFVVGKEGKAYVPLYKRIVEEGHTIAIHTYSHDYDAIYQSVDAYLQDFERIETMIEEVTGAKPEIFRFPGGSVNGYNAGIYQELIAEMIRRGYTYYDWNVTSKDTVAGLTADDILRNVAYAADEMDEDIIVLMHDGENHQATVEALPRMIADLKRQGYEFAGLDKDVEPVCFGY